MRRSQIIQKSESQSTLDGHLCERPTTERVIPYSDQLFREVATEWIIFTDQVRRSTVSLKFHSM